MTENKQKREDTKEHQPMRQAIKTFFISVAILVVPTGCLWINTLFAAGSANGWCSGCGNIHQPQYWSMGQTLVGFTPYIGLATAALVSIALAFGFKQFSTGSQVILTIAITISVMMLVNTLGMSFVNLSLTY